MGGGPRPIDESACPASLGPLNDTVRYVLERALGDERQAETHLDAVTAQFGETPLRQSGLTDRVQKRASTRIAALLAAHGAKVPEGVSAEEKSYVTLGTACERGVELEAATIESYDDALRLDLLPADVRCLFTQLRRSAVEQHMPAYQRCASSTTVHP